MSDTMKTLTIFSAILLPLTFISSLYGMNGLDLQNLFDLPIGFAILLATMGAISIGLFIFFKKKQWILASTDVPDTHANINNNKSTSKETAAIENGKKSFFADNSKKQ
jgi:hypothetical protein